MYASKGILESFAPPLKAEPKVKKPTSGQVLQSALERHAQQAQGGPTQSIVRVGMRIRGRFDLQRKKADASSTPPTGDEPL